MRVKTITPLMGPAVAFALASPLWAQTATQEPTSLQNTQTPAPTPVAAPPAESPHTARQPVGNADIIAMVQNRLSDEAILGMIELNETRFDVSAEDLIALKKAGVSDRVLNAMLEATRRREDRSVSAGATTDAATPAPRASGSSEAPGGAQAAVAGQTDTSLALTQTPPAFASPGAAPPGLDPRTVAAMQAALSRMQSMGYGGAGGFPRPLGMGAAGAGPGMGALFPKVFLLVAGVKTELTASTAERAVSKFTGVGGSSGAATLSSLASEALTFASIGAGPVGMMAKSSFSMLRGFMPGSRPSGPKITYAWGLPGAHSTRALPASQPAFEFVYKDIPGIDPDAFEPALVRLALTRDNYRLVGATRQEMRMAMGAATDPPDWVSEDRLPARLQKSERGAYTLLVEKSLPPGEYAVVLRPAKHYKAQPSGFGGADQLSATVWDFSLAAVTVAASPDKPH
jgi:hypothetical protein